MCPPPPPPTSNQSRARRGFRSTQTEAGEQQHLRGEPRKEKSGDQKAAAEKWVEPGGRGRDGEWVEDHCPHLLTPQHSPRVVAFTPFHSLPLVTARRIDPVPLLTTVKVEFIKAKLSRVLQVVNDVAGRRNCYKPWAAALLHDPLMIQSLCLRNLDSPGIS